MTATVGFIGLGNMGYPMAANLARAGFELVVRDADADRQRAFAEEFGAVSGESADTFAAAGTVVTMLPNGSVVHDAIVGAGVADVLAPGTLILDTSSSAPSATLALARELESRELAVADAPVSGGMVRALDGTLSIMLGADDDAVAQRAITVLDAMSARVVRTGGLGTGHAMKALNNYVLAAGFVAAGEALVMGERFGLDPAIVLDVLNASSGRNVATESVLPEEVLTRRFQARFSLGLITKDVGIAAGLAGELDLDAPLCDAVHERLAQAGEALGWGTDYTEAVRLWEQAAQTQRTGEAT